MVSAAWTRRGHVHSAERARALYSCMTIKTENPSGDPLGRNKFVQVRVSEREHRALVERAAAAGVTMSDYLRAAGLGERLVVAAVDSDLAQSFRAAAAQFRADRMLRDELLARADEAIDALRLRCDHARESC